MSDVVIDSSVAAKWFVPEPDSAQAQRPIVDATASANRLVVLDFALAEVANVIWKQYRQRRFTADETRSQLADLIAAPVRLENAPRLLNAALEIAIQYDRAICDALFIALAVDLGARGVTADEPLVNALA